MQITEGINTGFSQQIKAGEFLNRETTRQTELPPLPDTADDNLKSFYEECQTTLASYKQKMAAMEQTVSQASEKIAKKMISSGVEYAADLKTTKDDSQAYMCLSLLNHMADNTFDRNDNIHGELSNMILGVITSREQATKEHDEERATQVHVEKGAFYNGVVTNQNIHTNEVVPDLQIDAECKHIKGDK